MGPHEPELVLMIPQPYAFLFCLGAFAIIMLIPVNKGTASTVTTGRGPIIQPGWYIDANGQPFYWGG